MRVAIVTQEYPPETNWGGIGNFSHALAGALVAAGVNVDVVSCVQDQIPSVTHAGGVTVYRSGLPDARAIRARLWSRFPITDGRLVQGKWVAKQRKIAESVLYADKPPVKRKRTR